MSVPTSLGRMLDPIPRWFRVDTEMVLDGTVARHGLNVARGNPWIDSPIFDRLAGERFGK